MDDSFQQYQQLMSSSLQQQADYLMRQQLQYQPVPRFRITNSGSTEPMALLDNTIPSKSAAGFEVLYRYKKTERAKSAFIVAIDEKAARESFAQNFGEDDTVPEIVAVVAATVTL